LGGAGSAANGAATRGQCDSEYKGEKDAFRQVQRAIKGVGMEDGVDKYTGETLAQIVARASDEAKADAARGVTIGGSALALATLEQRAEKVLAPYYPNPRSRIRDFLKRESAGSCQLQALHADSTKCYHCLEI